MKPRELCESAWEEIADNFLDFKATKKGQNLKKVSKSKDITFEISFQSNRYNYSSSVRFSVHFLIQSKLMKKANINNGLIYGGELETIIDRGRIFRWFEIGGASYQSSVNEIIELLQKYILPICDDFENTETNIEKILNKKAKSSIIKPRKIYNKKRLIKFLFYYIYFFAGKEKAEQYFNKFISEDKLKSKYRGLYHSLEKLPKESIDVNISEFLGADIVKFAYLNGIKMD